MQFSEAVRSGYKNYVNPRGRASRSEYWWFALYSLLAGLVLVLTSIVIATALIANLRDRSGFQDLGIIVSTIAIVYIVGLFAFGIPLLFAQVRRLHDVGQSGWWVFASWGVSLVNLLTGRFLVNSVVADSPSATLLGLAGSVLGLVAFVFSLLPGQDRENQFGQQPELLAEPEWQSDAPPPPPAHFNP